MTKLNAQPVGPPTLWGRSVEMYSALTRPSGIAWVVASVAVLRGIAWFTYDPVTFDSAIYFEIAALIQTSRWSEALAHDYPPLYPLLIAGLQPLLGTADVAGLLVAFASGLLILLPIIAITRRAVGEEAAWAAAFLWAVHPSSIRLGVQALSDAPTAFCVAMALYAGLRALERHRLTWALGAGMASGLAFLFRPEGLEPAAALAVFYAFTAQSPSTGSGSRAESRDADRAQSAQGGRVVRRLGWILAPLVGWTIVAGPYVAHISVEAGSLTLSKKKSAADFVRAAVPVPVGERPSVTAAESPQEQKALPLPDQNQNWLRRFGRNIYVFQKPLVNGLNPLLLVVGCVGLSGILARRVERWNRIHGLLAGLFTLHLGILIGLAADKGTAYVARHHFLLMVVYMLPIAGAGLVWTLIWLQDRLHGRRWVPATALGLIVVATAFSLVTRGPDQGRSLRSAAVWIRSQVAGTPVVVTSLAKLTYHACAERVDMRGSYDAILRRARERSAHFVALYPDLIHLTSPDFLFRLGRGDLELVKVFPEPTRQAPDQRLEIYRLHPPSRDQR